MFPLTSFEQGSFTLITGPVKSEKTTILEAILNSAKDGRLMEKEPFLIVKHPKDDLKQPDHIGRHSAHSLQYPDEIARLLKEEHRHVIIGGISHYDSNGIVDLVDGLVRSNRNVVASGLNLNTSGMPYKHMPELMSLTDDVVLTKGICDDNGCFREDAVRNVEFEDGVFAPRCLHHFNYPGSPGTTPDRDGGIVVFAGPMFASKSVKWSSIVSRKRVANVPYVTFTWIDNTRYGTNSGRRSVFDEGVASLNNGKKISAVLVRNADDVVEYLKRNPRVRDVFIDEAMLLDNDYVNNKVDKSVLSVLNEYSARGFRFYLTGIHRNFKREPFFEMPKLMCVATHIEMSNAYCVVCAHPSTENQRMKWVAKGKYVPARYDDHIVATGGAKELNDEPPQCYEARCLKHFELPGTPDVKYKFPKWVRI